MRQGGVGVGEAGPGVRAEDNGPEGSDTKSSRTEVSGDEGVFEIGVPQLAVAVGWGVSCTMST